jgi:hypothetical protein
LDVLNPRGGKDLLGIRHVLGLSAARLCYSSLDLGRELRTLGEAVERRSLKDFREFGDGGCIDAAAEPDLLRTEIAVK